MTSKTTQYLSELTHTLEVHADHERAPQMIAYMKNHFPFLGITTPVRRAATHGFIRSFEGDPRAICNALWKKSEREYQYVACDLLRKHVKRLGLEHLDAFEYWITHRSWWDSVDGLTPSVGQIVLRDNTANARMDAWLASDNFWLRRSALLHQLGWKMQTDYDRLFDYCLRCANEREFFIRKAIGWALRDYARHAPERVTDFLNENRHKLSSLSYREAAKHLALD